jgi:ribonuclease BN (tRNA processing enzyme)
MSQKILIHDAQYTPEQMPSHKGWGHSSWMHCTEVASKAKAKKLVLFHHNPDHGDSTLESIEQDAKKLFKNTISAREGMEIFIPEEVSEAVIS